MERLHNIQIFKHILSFALEGFPFLQIRYIMIEDCQVQTAPQAAGTPYKNIMKG